ncbi:MAG: LuxR C-terminal-related transcriptional regulator [Syntrophobacteraceae bacterium]|nr:LuxR C-terminal-related transcriptional regulator [Syntrophobacteraceae bacterium]
MSMTVKLLLVSKRGSLLSAISDSLLDGAIFSWTIEIAESVTSALRKVGREHFDACLLDNSLTEADSTYFLTKMAEGHRNLALVVLQSCEERPWAPEYAEIIDGSLPFFDRAFAAQPGAGQSVESRLVAAMLSCKERENKAKAASLDELHRAMNVIMQRVGRDAFEIEERIQLNLERLIFPYIEQLKSTRLQSGQKWRIDLLESNIRRVFSPFLKNLTAKSPRLSYAETRVADLIREGKSSKEIANMLGVSEKTVLTHRFHIRTKLGIRNTEVSLKTYLTSLQ